MVPMVRRRYGLKLSLALGFRITFATHNTRMPAESVQVSSPGLTTQNASKLEFCFSDPNWWDGNVFRSNNNFVSELEI